MHKQRILFQLLIILWPFSITAQQAIGVIKNLPVGSVVSISGTITTGNEWGTIRYMQDSSGGIGVFSTSLAGTAAGDSLTINGVLSSYRGQLQISPVLSFQVIGNGKTILPEVIPDFGITEMAEHNSEMVTLHCPGVHSCETFFSPGTLTLYDQKGQCITAVISEVDLLFGQTIFREYAWVTGVLTTLDGQQRLLIDALGPQATCNNIYPPNAYYLGRHMLVDFDGLPARQTVVQWGKDDFNNQIDFEIPAGSIGVDFSDLPAAELYQVRVQQIDGQDTFYSKPAHFTPSISGKPIEVFFNRSIDASFSDGSTPAGVGGTVIEQDLIRRIDSVSTTLDIAMYNTGRDPIVQAINRAVQRGVEVRYIADDETSNNSLGIANFPVYYRGGDGIMHNKFVIGDASDSARVWLWSGSTNLTSNQLSTDPNHAYVICDKALALTYQNEFDELWGQQPNHGDARVGETKDDNTCHHFLYNDILMDSYFSPSDETECHIVDALRTADHQLLIGLLLLTSDDLIEAIIDRHEAGVAVRVILEDEESSSYAVNRLHLAGIPYALHDPGPIYHHKIAIIDEGYTNSDPMVVSGSHNWTWSADHINDENTLIFHDQTIANLFRQEYEARWAELTPVATASASQAEIHLFPNPASSIIILENPFTSTSSFALFDACGVLQQSASLAADEKTSVAIDAAIPNGLYTIRIANGNNQVISKLVIQR